MVKRRWRTVLPAESGITGHVLGRKELDGDSWW